MNQQRLLEEILRQRKHDIAPIRADIVHQLDERPVIVNVPKQVRQKDQESREPAKPKPRTEQRAALRSQQKPDDHTEAEQSDRIFFLQAQSRDDAEPKPIPRIVSFDGENREVGAAHPQIGFEAVGTEQACVGQILWRDDDGDGAEQQGEAPSAEFTSQESRLHHQQGRSQCRNKSNAAQRVSQDGAADVNQKGNERRLIHIAPGQVVATIHVVKLIPEIAIAVVEIAMKQEFCQRNGNDDEHAIRQVRSIF